MADAMKTVTDQLEELMQSGSESEVRQFILDHMQEFPADAQREFAVGFFEDALAEQASANEQLLRDREDAVKAIDALENNG